MLGVCAQSGASAYSPHRKVPVSARRRGRSILKMNHPVNQSLSFFIDQRIIQPSCFVIHPDEKGKSVLKKRQRVPAIFRAANASLPFFIQKQPFSVAVFHQRQPEGIGARLCKGIFKNNFPSACSLSLQRPILVLSFQKHARRRICE